MTSNKIIKGLKKAARHARDRNMADAGQEVNRRVLMRLHGVPLKKGTPLTDMDPLNPNKPLAANDNDHH